MGQADIIEALECMPEGKKVTSNELASILGLSISVISTPLRTLRRNKGVSFKEIKSRRLAYLYWLKNPKVCPKKPRKNYRRPTPSIIVEVHRFGCSSCNNHARGFVGCKAYCKDCLRELKKEQKLQRIKEKKMGKPKRS